MLNDKLKLREDSIVLCFDYGLKRIGVAVGNLLTQTARPLSVVHWSTNEQKWKAVLACVSEWKPDVIVVGVPFHDDGNPNSMTEVCRRFGRQLQGRVSIPIVYEDERFSSVEAESYLGSDEYIDDEAASIILQQWLNH